MNEYQTKVAELKQSFQEPGFSVEDQSPSDNQADNQSDSNHNIIDDNIDNNNDPKLLETPEVRTRKKHTNTFKRRIDQLTYENKIRESQNQELLARVRNQEQLLAEKQNQLEQNEQYKNAYYENNLQTREAAIINELKAAKEEGDLDKEINLSKALSQVTAEQATYGLYKSQLRNKNYSNPEYYQNNNYHPQQHDQYSNQNNAVDYEEPVDEHLENWMENNPWANSHSPSFSPRLYKEVNELASELNETLKYNGYTDMIGTPAYYSSLDNLMAERYSVRKPQNQEDSLRQNSYNNSSMVAPVSRSGSSLADRYMANNPNNNRRSTQLTDEEYKIARNLQIKMPNGRWANSDEAIKRYAESKALYGNSNSTKLIIE